jgi:hypothetical protein
MDRRYELVSQRTKGYDCLDAECDRKSYWSVESSGMNYRAYSCKGHLHEVCQEIADAGDSVMRIARWG